MTSIFKTRPISFIEVFICNDWRIKLYTITYDSAVVSIETINIAKSYVGKWLLKSQDYNLPTYKVATLIIHKWRGGHFAIIGWWIDENMMQILVFLASNEEPLNFRLYSDKGIVTCVWELEILWFERNAWVEEVLKKQITESNIHNYLQITLNKS
jgi:hypothetical protein